MSYIDLEEEPDARLHITTPESRRRREDMEKRGIPVPNTYPFGEDDKQKVFRLAQKFGGQVTRTWGPYEEVLAEFPGEAWQPNNTDPENQ